MEVFNIRRKGAPPATCLCDIELGARGGLFWKQEIDVIIITKALYNMHTQDEIMERVIFDGSFESILLVPENLRDDIPHRNFVSRRDKHQALPVGHVVDFESTNFNQK